MELEEVKTRYEEVPVGQLFLERVEAAAMGVLVKAIIDDDRERAIWSVELMERLSIL